MAKWQMECDVDLSLVIASEHPAMDGDAAWALAEGRVRNALDTLKELGVVSEYNFGSKLVMIQGQCKPLQITKHP